MLEQGSEKFGPFSHGYTYSGHALGAAAALAWGAVRVSNDELELRSQSQIMGIPAGATAGVMTSRAASEAFFVAGTNRAMFRFTLPILPDQ